MKQLSLLGFVSLAVVLSVSAQAACGGGGFNAPKQPTSSSSGTTVVQQSSAGITGRNSNSFDVSKFHAISGQLHLSGEQATGVINAIQDIRRKLDESATPPKDFDPKQEFNKRLSTILNPEQIKIYQSATKSS